MKERLRNMQDRMRRFNGHYFIVPERKNSIKFVSEEIMSKNISEFIK